MRSIRTILSFMVGVIVLAAVLTVTVGNYWHTSQYIKEELRQEIAQTTATTARHLGDWLLIRQTEMEMLAHSPVMASGDKAAIIAYLQAESKRLSLFSAFWLADPAGNWYSPSGTSGSISERAYYKQLISSRKTVISEPLIGKADGKLAFVIAVPVEVNGQLVGILGGNVRMDEFASMVASIKVGASGYAVLSAADGTTVVHPDSEKIMKYNPLNDSQLPAALRDICQKRSQGQTSLDVYNDASGEQYIAYTRVPGVTWSLTMTAWTKEFMEPLYHLLWLTLATTLGILMVVMGLIWFAAQRLSRPLTLLQGAVTELAGGNLRDQATPLQGSQELVAIGQAFKQMRSHWRELVGRLGQQVGTVARSSAELSDSARQAAEAAGQVAASISDVAGGSERQLQAVSEATTAMERLSGRIQQVAAQAELAVNRGQATAAAAEHGGVVIGQVIEQMQTIERTVQRSAADVALLGERSREIGQIVDTIAGIAGQTNLLALNAAIEAARAGDVGRGFAVVADEVRKLAEQSQTAASQIAALIANIQQDTRQAVTAMEEGTAAVQTGSLVVGDAGVSFQTILEHIEAVSQQVREIAGAVEHMAADSSHIVSAVQAVEGISRQTAGETQVVSAATQQQSAALQQIAAASQALDALAGELQAAVSVFKT